MPRPLHSSLARTALQLGTGNAGLWYDKLCDRWSDDWSLSGDQKLEWIKTVTKTPVGPAALLTESAKRMLHMTLARGGIFGVFVTESRFITGLGRSHPVENGFTWHPALGVPYLPGSSVKGLVRAWAERDAEPTPSDNYLNEIFGSPHTAGRVAFTDVLPIAPVQLDADVVTPHYGGWSAEEPPADWRSPVPIPFLVSAERTAFVFSLLPLRPTDSGELQEVFKWLHAALVDAGAGAKTSVGYGRFRYDESKTTAWTDQISKERAALVQTRRRAEAQATPEARWMFEVEGKKEQDLLELVRVHLEKEPLPDPTERAAFAQAVQATGVVTSWRRGQKQDPRTSTGSKKLKERARLVDVELNLDTSKGSRKNG